MDKLNIDCLIYISKFLSFRDKINLIKTSKKMYELRFFIFKDDLVDYEDNNTKWLKICKPKIRLTRLNKRILSTTSIFKNIVVLFSFTHKFDGYIPTGVLELVNLTSLTIASANIRFIPKEIEKLQKLTHLNLSGNQIVDCTPCFSCVNLTILDLSDNKIEHLPDEIQNTSHLTELYLYWNRLKCIPNAINKLVNLKLLDVQNNLLTRIPLLVMNLQKLNLEDNKLTCICNCIPKTIISLNLTDNENLKCRLHNLEFLTELYISETNMTFENIPIDCQIYD